MTKQKADKPVAILGVKAVDDQLPTSWFAGPPWGAADRCGWAALAADQATARVHPGRSIIDLSGCGKHNMAGKEAAPSATVNNPQRY